SDDTNSARNSPSGDQSYARVRLNQFQLRSKVALVLNSLLHLPDMTLKLQDLVNDQLGSYPRYLRQLLFQPYDQLPGISPTNLLDMYIIFGRQVPNGGLKSLSSVHHAQSPTG